LIRDLTIPHLQIFDWRSNRVQPERFAGIQEKPSVWICSENSSHQRSMEIKKEWIVFWEKLEQEAWKEKVKEAKVFVFFDPPPSMELFRQALTYCYKAERLYFIYGDADFDDLLVKMPTREQFKLLYQTLVGKGPISMNKHLSSLMRVTGLQKRPLSFMIQVFEELEFLKIEQGQIIFNNQPQKRALTESKLYQRQVAREQVLQTLVYSSYRELCNYLFTSTPFKWDVGGNVDGFQREDPGDSGLSTTGNSL
jgi:single-stranded-DNA-specific exonuclease